MSIESQASEDEQLQGAERWMPGTPDDMERIRRAYQAERSRAEATGTNAAGDSDWRIPREEAERNLEELRKARKPSKTLAGRSTTSPANPLKLDMLY